LQKPGRKLSQVLSDPCSERYRTLSKMCISTLKVQRSMARSPEVRANIRQSHSGLSLPMETKKDQVRRQLALSELDQLKAVGPTVATSPAR
jgi:hypothetical protein